MMWTDTRLRLHQSSGASCKLMLEETRKKRAASEWIKKSTCASRRVNPVDLHIWLQRSTKPKICLTLGLGADPAAVLSRSSPAFTSSQHKLLKYVFAEGSSERMRSVDSREVCLLLSVSWDLTQES
ncbi:hypothetical protein DNTS_030954 [Danionella cerebrum]|uniref:Uncharacterized protein n=1 Tax=Danionella cerebrum TaxID=2873325 RepID=A0A553MXQ6_9TELE|nr:hypothetical protein DNTS_030954 [Danionella translucida]